jgi:hypothetical protein
VLVPLLRPDPDKEMQGVSRSTGTLSKGLVWALVLYPSDDYINRTVPSSMSDPTRLVSNL